MTFLAAAGGAISGGVLCAAVALNVPSRAQRRLEQVLMTQVLPDLVTRAEVSGAFARIAEAEGQREQREQYMAQLAAQQAQAARSLQVMQRPPGVGPAGLYGAEAMPNPLFQAEAPLGLDPSAAAARPGTQPGLDQMQQQLNQQLAQLNQRLQTVATQRMPR